MKTRDQWDAEYQAKFQAWRRANEARHAARLAAGDPIAIRLQAGRDRAEAEQRWHDQRERERILKLLGDNAPKRKRGPQKFKKRDIERAVAGHMHAGLSVQRTEIDNDGRRIVIVTGQPEQVPIAPKQAVSEWD
jgi:hypothetical protein